MSFKKLLGLEHTHLTEEEIVQALNNAATKHLQDLEFNTGKNKVTVHLGKVSKAGMMRGYWDYYGK